METDQIESGLGLGDSRCEFNLGLEFIHGRLWAVFQQRDYIGDLAEGSGFPGGTKIDDDFLTPCQKIEDVVEGAIAHAIPDGMEIQGPSAAPRAFDCDGLDIQ